ncbi:MAG: ribosome small subunit-dependent GTPase A [Rhizobiaceae bacterium]
MKRDYSKFVLPGSAATKSRTFPTESPASTLESLGWQHFFAQQTDLNELAQAPPARVVEVHRSGLKVVGEEIDTMLPPRQDVTVGDWLMVNRKHPIQSRILERKSLLKRRAAGHDRRIQLIAANIDTALVVSSCNQDFNIARLERYVAVALEAGIEPVIVLTKSDLCSDVVSYVEQASAISNDLVVIAVDARGNEPAQKLTDWCRQGQSLALLGSSGVGKSTLTNGLTGAGSKAGGGIATQPIREDDAKGRHTTTSRRLHLVTAGWSLIDMPGMREIQLADTETGIAGLFADLEELAQSCRFNDCGHTNEPGCAIVSALENDQLDEARLTRWQKLLAEDRFNTSSLAERKAKDKALGKLIRQINKSKSQR